jgi:hypothetical protein
MPRQPCTYAKIFPKEAVHLVQMSGKSMSLAISASRIGVSMPRSTEQTPFRAADIRQRRKKRSGGSNASWPSPNKNAPAKIKRSACSHEVASHEICAHHRVRRYVSHTKSVSRFPGVVERLQCLEAPTAQSASATGCAHRGRNRVELRP